MLRALAVASLLVFASGLDGKDWDDKWKAINKKTAGIKAEKSVPASLKRAKRVYGQGAPDFTHPWRSDLV